MNRSTVRTATGDPRFEVPDITKRQFQFLINRKWFVALGALLGLAHGVSFLIFKQPIYESRSKLIVTSEVAPLAAQNPNQAAAPDADFAPTVISIMQSTTFIDEAIQKGKLNELKTFFGIDTRAAILKSLRIDRERIGLAPATENTMVTSFRGPIPEDCEEVLNGINASLQAFFDGRRGGRKITIVSPPEIGQKLTPLASINLTAGLLFGLLMGVLFAFLADRMHLGLDRRHRLLSRTSTRGANHVR